MHTRDRMIIRLVVSEFTSSPNITRVSPCFVQLRSCSIRQPISHLPNAYYQRYVPIYPLQCRVIRVMQERIPLTVEFLHRGVPLHLLRCPKPRIDPKPPIRYVSITRNPTSLHTMLKSSSAFGKWTTSVDDHALLLVLVIHVQHRFIPERTDALVHNHVTYHWHRCA